MSRARSRHWWLAALAILVACGGRVPDEGREPDVIRLGYQRYVSYAPIFLADAAGYFASHGIALELVQMPDGNAGTPLVVSGAIDVLAGPGSPGVLNAISRGANVRLVADKGSIPDTGCSQMALVGRPGLRLAPAALRTVSPGRAVAALEYFTERALADAGLRLDQLEVHHIPTSVHAEALSRGSIDLVATTEPAVTRLVAAGNMLISDAREVVPGLPYGFIVFGERLTTTDRELGERFMTAYLEGMRAYAAGKTEGNVGIVGAATGDEAELVARSCWPPLRTDGIDTTAFAAFQDWAVGRRLLDRRLNPVEYWDGRFLDAAARAVAEHEHRR